MTRTALRTGASGAGTGAGDVTGGSSDAGGINGAGGPGSAGAGVTGGGAAGTAGGAAKSAGARAGAASGAAGSTCRTPVKIGATYSSDISAGLAAVGNPTAAADAANYVQQQQALWQRAADDLNRRGGLAGCPVTVVFHDFKVLSSSGFSGESQTECADLAEDQHVFAVVSTTLENKTLITCLAQHHVVSFFYSPVYQPSPDDYAHYRGLLYEPTGLTPYRFGPFIDQYAAAGYFPPGAKVGILLADDGSGSNQYLVNQLWKPRLAARGINPVVFTYPLVQNVSDNSSIASEFSSAVLQFKAAGVDHVMVTPDNGDATIFFTPVAESQGFRPRYALDSATGAAVWSGAPAGQRANALNISYQLQDLGGTPDPAEMASNPPSTARSRCDALFKGHTGSSPPSVAYWACDPFDLMQAALNGASAVTPETLVAGVDRIHSLAASNGYSDMAFGAPNHYDGATSTRMMIWDEGAKKWHYLAPPQSVP